MFRSNRQAIAAVHAAALMLLPAVAAAHGPIFTFNARTEFKGAKVYELGYGRTEVGGEAENEYELGFGYGVTSDLTVGMAVPYVRGTETEGTGDLRAKGKYRFRREAEGSSLTSWTVLAGGNPDTSDRDESAGSVFAALAYGYEGLEWYRWAGLGVRMHRENAAGIEPGDTLELGVAGDRASPSTARPTSCGRPS